MTCRDLERRIDAYLDGELDAAAEAEVGAHLDECPDCRAQFGPLVSAVEALGELPELRAPAGLVEGAMGRLPERRASLARAGWALGLAGAVATALIGLVGLWTAQGLAVGGNALLRAIIGVPDALAQTAGGWLHLGLTVAEVSGGALAQPVGLALLVNVALLGAATAVILGWRRLMPAMTRVLA